MVKGDSLLRDQAGSFIVDLAADEEDCCCFLLFALRRSRFLAHRLVLDILIVSIEKLLHGAEVNAEFVYHIPQLWWKLEEWEDSTDLELLKPRKELAISIKVNETGRRE